MFLPPLAFVIDDFAFPSSKSCRFCVNFKSRRENVLTNAHAVPYNVVNFKKKEIALMCNRVSAMMMRFDMCVMYMSIAAVIR